MVSMPHLNVSPISSIPYQTKRTAHIAARLAYGKVYCVWTVSVALFAVLCASLALFIAITATVRAIADTIRDRMESHLAS